MNFNVTSVKAFTFLIVAFILHNSEEAFMMKGYSVKSPFTFVEPPSFRQFLIAVSLLTIAVIVAYSTAIRTKKPKVYLFISTAVAAALLFNVFVPHVVGAIFYRDYTPGLISAVVLNLPFSFLVLVKNKPMYTGGKEMRSHILWGLAAGYTFFAAILGLAKLVAH